MKITEMIEALELRYKNISAMIHILDESLEKGEDVSSIIRNYTNEIMDILDAIKALRKVTTYDLV